jgi:hypothetical protein
MHQHALHVALPGSRGLHCSVLQAACTIQARQYWTTVHCSTVLPGLKIHTKSACAATALLSAAALVLQHGLSQLNFISVVTVTVYICIWQLHKKARRMDISSVIIAYLKQHCLSHWRSEVPAGHLARRHSTAVCSPVVADCTAPIEAPIEATYLQSTQQLWFISLCNSDG